MKTRTKTLQLHDWMLSLGLTEKEERVYALIYGYSQDGVSRMRGTSGSIAEWLHCSESTAKRITRSLEAKGLICHEVIAWSNGEIGGTLTEFWAIDPDDAAAPIKRDKITWKRRGVGSRMNRGGRVNGDPRGRFMDEPTPLIGTTRNKYISGGCGKNNARSRAKKTTTTTTGFLFENEFLNIPFGEDFFLDAWKALLKQPKWAGKTPEALQIVLDRFALTNDPVLSAFCCIKAIERDWATIADPSKIGLEDQDQLLAYNDTIKARKEGAQL